jgi:hypothetical protein
MALTILFRHRMSATKIRVKQTCKVVLGETNIRIQKGAGFRI